jgi:hypothetical protein
MVMDFIGGITNKVNQDIDRVKRAMGVTPYRWRLVFITTQEIAEREMAFGSPEGAFYNVQDFLLARRHRGLSSTGDLVELSIVNARTGQNITQLGKRAIGPGQRWTVGYLVAEHLGYEI